MLGTRKHTFSSVQFNAHGVLQECTFLGPSRKRGPPKGYIDAIEARLHQTEALIGIMLATKDERAKSLLDDFSKVRICPVDSENHFKRK